MFFCPACFKAQQEPFHKGDDCPVHPKAQQEAYARELQKAATPPVVTRGDIPPPPPRETLPIEDLVNPTPTPEEVAAWMPPVLAPKDNVYHPPHYSRFEMEPIEFIATNNLPWWLANVIKYTLRFDAKDGLQDLYKARSYLDMKIRQLEGHPRFWDKPVTEERAANGK